MKNTMIAALAVLAGLVSCSKGGFREYAADADVYDSAYGAMMMNGGTNRPGQSGGAAGVLTAGEWNDLSHWDFWSKLMASQDYGDISQFWGMYTPRRVDVRIADAAGKRLPAVRVALEQDQKTIWSTLTDNQGEASLWVDPFRADASAEGLVLLIDGVRQSKAPVVSPFNVQQKEAVVNYFQIDGAKAPEKRADIAFIVDATGSMSDEIDFLKKDLVDILDRVKGGQGDIALRTGTVFYRDEQDDYVTKYSKFTDDYRETAKYISMQSADGGGDLPEAVHTALEAGLQNLDWNTSARARIAFLILDAPAHQDHQGVVESLQKSVKQYAALGVKLIPVFCSGPDKSCEFMCRLFAILTGGTYVFLTDDSGVGDDHLEPTVGDYQIEPLNDLLVRLIAKYIG